MITGKIILKSATKLTLDKRFGDIAKQSPPPTATPRIQQQANVIIPYSRKDLFGGNNKRPVALNIAQRLKKRSINYRLGLNSNANLNRPYAQANRPRVFQRLGLPNRRRGAMGNSGGANSYLFGGQSGLGIRLRGQGRIGGTRTFRSRTRGYLNNNAVSRFSGYAPRGNPLRNNRGRRGGNNNNNNNNFNRSNRGRGGPNTNNRGGPNTNNRGGRGRGRGNRGMNNNNRNLTKESLDSELDNYMAQTKLDPESNEMDAV